MLRTSHGRMVRGSWARAIIGRQGKDLSVHSGYSMMLRNSEGKPAISSLRKLKAYGSELVMDDAPSQEIPTWQSVYVRGLIVREECK